MVFDMGIFSSKGSKEGGGIEAEHIEGGQEGSEDADDIIDRVFLVGSRQDLVFGEESRERRYACNGEAGE